MTGSGLRAPTSGPQPRGQGLSRQPAACPPLCRGLCPAPLALRSDHVSAPLRPSPLTADGT